MNKNPEEILKNKDIVVFVKNKDGGGDSDSDSDTVTHDTLRERPRCTENREYLIIIKIF